MMRHFLAILFTFFLLSTVNAQNKAGFFNRVFRLNSIEGFTNQTNFTLGYGLADRGAPFSKSFIGLTNTSGYQITRNFRVGAGTGVSFYESGILVPLYLELRHYRYINKFTPFFSASGGLLLDPADLKSGTKIFVNPGFGIKEAVSETLLMDAGAGLLVQMGPFAPRESFINLRIGVTYKKRAGKGFK